MVDYLHMTVSLTGTYSEEEIHRAIDILRTNEVQIKHPTCKHKGPLVGQSTQHSPSSHTHAFIMPGRQPFSL